MKKKYITPESSIVDLRCGRIMQANVEIGSGTVPTSEFDAKKNDGSDFDEFFENNFDKEFEGIVNNKQGD